MQLFPNELALANLKVEISEDERVYCSVDVAVEWLKELSGLDFGKDVAKGEDWVREQNKKIPSKQADY